MTTQESEKPDEFFKKKQEIVAFSHLMQPPNEESNACATENCDPSNNDITAFATIDFADLVPNKSGRVVIRTEPDSKKIMHTLPKLDRCCKLNGKVPWYDGFDNFKRMSCNDISPENFENQYIKKRDVVLLRDCMDGWKAWNWNIKG